MKSFERLREHYPNQKVEVTRAKKLGSGGSGEVFETVERKLNALHDLLTKEKANGYVRVAKYMRRPYRVSQDDFKRAVFSEYELAKRTPHLHVKFPVEISADEYCIVMDRQPGEELFDLLVKIHDHELSPTAHQYMLLVIALLQALQYQVEGCDLVHQDIKPENIMLDWSNLNNPIVRIMDYGHAKDSNTVQYKIVGTPAYASPEVSLHHNTTIKADIFSLGMTLLMLLIKNYDQDFVDHYRDEIGKHIAEDKLLFWKKLAPVNNKLKNLIMSMCEYQPNDRDELHELLIQAHQMRIELAYPAYSLAVKQQMLNACNEGLLVREALSNSKSILKMPDIIARAVVVGEKEMVSEFLKGLDMRAFDSCNSHAELVKLAREIVSLYAESHASLVEATYSMRLLNREYEAAAFSDDECVNSKLKHCLAVLERKVEKYDLKRCKSFDELVYASKRCVEITRLTTAALKDIRSDFEVLQRERYSATIKTARIMLDTFNSFKQKYKDYKFFRAEGLGVVIDVCIDRVHAEFSAHDNKCRANQLSMEEVNSVNNQLSLFLQRMPNVLDVMIKNRCQLVFARMQRYQLESSLDEVMIQLKQTQPGESEDLQRLKSIIRFGITKYIYSTASGRNLFFHERAASARRIDDMQAILQQVNAVNDVAELKLRLNAQLGTIKTGFFGRSQLRSEVEEAMEMHARLQS